MAQKTKTFVEWFKPANQPFNIGFGTAPEIVSAGTTLENGQTPVVELHELTQEFPEVWTDITSDVGISNQGIVDDVDENGKLILTDGAVQFTMDAEPVTDAPLPGDTYSFFVMANRADDPSLQVATRVWVRIMP